MKNEKYDYAAACYTSGISVSDIAKRLGVKEKEARKIIAVGVVFGSKSKEHILSIQRIERQREVSLLNREITNRQINIANFIDGIKKHQKEELNRLMKSRPIEEIRDIVNGGLLSECGRSDAGVITLVPAALEEWDRLEAERSPQHKILWILTYGIGRPRLK